MVAVDTISERYADLLEFSREVNLPLLGAARVRPIHAGAGLAQILEASAGSDALGSVVDGLSETRKSVNLRSLLLAGFPHDSECFALGLTIAREWSRRGLKVAVADLDFWNPTVIRPPSHPNEGLVDVLEYGCSFGRVAWEVVADRLWLIGPGSHPPDEGRIAEHPDWERAARVFASHVDVTLYVAALLDRRGFTGKLSKRMDAALLAASVERVARADLRDAFLELWGSDAPMIGCVAIEPVPESPGPRVEVARALDREMAATERAKPSGEGVMPLGPRPSQPRPAVSVLPAATRETEGRAEHDLEVQLERDVRRGIVERRSRRGGAKRVWIGAAIALAAATGAFGIYRANQTGPTRGAVEARQPAGEEPVAPAPPDAAPPAASPSATQPSPAQHEAAPLPDAAQPTAAVPAPAGTNADAAKPYWVRVAAFRTRTKAEATVAWLKGKGLDAWYEPPVPGGTWYRIYAGRFASEAEARAYADQIVKSGLVDYAQSDLREGR